MKKEDKARILLHAMSEIDEHYLEEAAEAVPSSEVPADRLPEKQEIESKADGKPVLHLKSGRRGLHTAAAAAAVVLVFGTGLYMGSSGIGRSTSSLMLENTGDFSAASDWTSDSAADDSYNSLTSAGSGSVNYKMSASGAKNSFQTETAEINASEGSNALTDSVDTDAIPASRKLIRTVNLSFETTDLPSFVDELTQQTGSLGGYVESSDISGNESIGQNRHAYLTLRIPSGQLDSFLQQAEGEANLTRKYESTEDITLQYHDIESRKKALQTEYDRLLELMAQADSVDTVISIEQRLSDLRYQLDSYSSDLRLYDNEVDYATVTVDISEATVLSATEGSSFRQRVESKLSQNLEDLMDAATEFAVWFLSVLPLILPIGVAGLGICFIVKRIRHKRKAKENHAKD